MYNYLKVNEFIEHFSEHRQEKNGFGFFEFIKLHYIDQQVYDDDYAQDMRLPFKTAHVQFLGAIDISHKPEIGLPVYRCGSCNKVSQKSDFILPQSFIVGIWQPPRA